MPEMRILKRTRRAQRQGKAPMNVMGEFTAIGIAKGRRSGPKRATAKSRVTVERDVKRTKKPRRARRARAAIAAVALKRAGRKAASPRVLSQSARRASAKRKGNRRASATARSRARKASGSRSRSMR